MCFCNSISLRRSARKQRRTRHDPDFVVDFEVEDDELIEDEFEDDDENDSECYTRRSSQRAKRPRIVDGYNYDCDGVEDDGCDDIDNFEIETKQSFRSRPIKHLDVCVSNHLAAYQQPPAPNYAQIKQFVPNYRFLPQLDGVADFDEQDDFIDYDDEEDSDYDEDNFVETNEKTNVFVSQPRVTNLVSSPVEQTSQKSVC